MKNEKTVVDIDYAEAIVPKSARRGIVTMFMIMLGFTFFSASMWVGQQLADGLDFQGFVVSMIVGGVILRLNTGLLGYVGAETGMSLDLLARMAFGVKGSYLPSAMISFTQIGWFGVGIAMIAIPDANELLGGSKTAEWALVIGAGICMTASADFGIKSLTIGSYIAVPMVAVLGTVAMILAVMRGDGTIVDQFAKSSGTLPIIGGAGLLVGLVNIAASIYQAKVCANGIAAIGNGHDVMGKTLILAAFPELYAFRPVAATYLFATLDGVNLF